MTTAAASPEQVRRDARDNRAAILDAARELFAGSADVAMCQVARRAGVGQATLYRNFPNRSVLVAEILDEQVERVATLAADHEGDPDAFFVLLRSLIDGMVNLYALAVLARSDAMTDSHLKRAHKRIREFLKRPLLDAKAVGTLRQDVVIDDVFLLLAMARGAMEGAEGWAARSAAGSRMLNLTLEGLVPNSASA